MKILKSPDHLCIPLFNSSSIFSATRGSNPSFCPSYLLYVNLQAEPICNLHCSQDHLTHCPFATPQPLTKCFCPKMYQIPISMSLTRIQISKLCFLNCLRHHGYLFSSIWNPTIFSAWSAYLGLEKWSCIFLSTFLKYRSMWLLIILGVLLIYWYLRGLTLKGC